MARVAGSSTGSLAYPEDEAQGGPEEPRGGQGVVGKPEGLDRGELEAVANVAKTVMAAAIAEAEVVAEELKNTETVSPQGNNTKSGAAASARVRYQPVFALDEAEKVDELMGPRTDAEGKQKPGLMPTARSKNDVFRMSVLIAHRILLRQEEGFTLALVKDGEARALELIV